MASAPAGEQVRFVPFSSNIEVAFWQKLTQIKLDKLKLVDTAVPLTASYSPVHHPGNTAAFNITVSSLDYISEHSLESLDAKTSPLSAAYAHSPAAHAIVAPGTLQNVNTKEEFKTVDKQAVIKGLGEELWSAIRSKRALEDPALLLRFHLLTYADIKKWVFFHWNCTPALVPPTPVTSTAAVAPLASTGVNPQAVHDAHTELRTRSGGRPVPFFLVHTSPASEVTAAPLTEWDALSAKEGEVFLAYADPSPRGQAASWPLVNFLILANVAFGLKSARVIGLRVAGPSAADDSVVMTVTIPEVDASADEWPGQVMGWEPNARGKMGPRLVDLGRLMDSKRLAETSVDLNLKLMRWRLMPELDTEKVSETKCLLLGSGTLGCNVARCLLGWGVRHMTFVDNGKVSFSNPVRQTLFIYEDCLNGGKDKAATAAEAVKKIFPSVQSEGHTINIPMPGHSVSEAGREDMLATVNKLSALVESHDVVFLLTDTRESRWLPTLLARVHGKPLYNAAMGFDTYVVMRHGVFSPEQEAEKRLGCYFCNDVVAPTDSLTNRSLDQQCTVTRPGLSMITSATLVELMVAAIHHPKGHAAPADTQQAEAHGDGSPLGLLPHQVRGGLARLENTMMIGRAFDKCTACSETVVNAYNTTQSDFLMQVFNTPSYLEDLTGLSALKAAVDDVDWDVDSDGDGSRSGDDW